jgi:hypothetical protein
MAHKNTPNTQSPVVTKSGFDQAMNDFLKEIKCALAQDERGRTRFPGFQVPRGINDKAINAINAFRGMKFRQAYDLLKDAQQHFASCQAAWARRLVDGLIDETVSMAQRNFPEKILKPARDAVAAYEEYAAGYLIPGEASKLYWAAVDAIEKAETAYRQSKADAEMEKRAAREARNYEAQQLERERIGDIADILEDELVSILDGQTV